MQNLFQVTTELVREKRSLDWKKWKVVGLQGTGGVCCLPVRHEVAAGGLGEEEERRMSSFALRSRSDPKYYFIAFLLAAGNIRAGRQ